MSETRTMATAIMTQEAFVQAWKEVVNSPEAKKGVDKHYGNRYSGCLHIEHHLLYVILKGNDWNKSFTPISNPNRLNHVNGNPWETLNDAEDEQQCCEVRYFLHDYS